MKNGWRKSLITFIATTAIALVVFFHTRSTKELFMNQAAHTIQQNAIEKANQIQTSIDYSINSIELLSEFTSKQMTEKELKDPNKVFKAFDKKTPFNNIEYVRWDGINMMNNINNAEPFDASDREYYKKGIMGVTGIWNNFAPKFTEETLITFYTPLYYESEIAGVLTGVIGGQSGIEPLLQSHFFGQRITAILCDENFNVISSNYPKLAHGLDLKEYRNDIFIKNVIQHAEINDDTPFSYTIKGGKGFCCVATIPSMNWKVIMVVYPSLINSSMKDVTFEMYSIISIIIIILISYLLAEIYIYKSSDKKIQKKQTGIINALTVIYENMFLIDNLTSEITSYGISESAKERYGDIFSKMSYEDALRLYIKNDVMEEDKILFNPILTIDKVKKIFESRNEYSLVYKTRRGRKTSYFQYSLFNSAEYPRYFVVGFKNIDKLMEKQLEYQKREQNLITTATRDELTGLLNRHAYEKELQFYSHNPPEDNYIHVAFDVNGLKNVNDTLGHEAGDELIKGAADCMIDAFGNFGKVFRTGGDEFQAILFSNPGIFAELKEAFENTTEKWKGKLVNELRISVGYVLKAEVPEHTVEEIARLADERMYKSKSIFYSKKGIDRRGQNIAFKALCESYMKILKVDLAKDSFSIIQLIDSEKNIEDAYCEKISDWFKNFGNSGQIHEDDIEEYMQKTDIAFIRKFFKDGNKQLVVRYRRKVEDQFHKVRMEMISAKGFTKEDQIIFLYVKDID